ncbi:MAG: hypothetical protein KAS12_06300, partial [Candidatus Aenigmarchaeota archaeon]|nr:hypothetical protein [Candidatus Aenigmarchaeota archaeon]
LAPVENTKCSSTGLAPEQSAINEKKNNLFLFSHRKIIYPSLLLLILVCGYFLWRARTGQFILSQWWSISPFYLYAYLGVLFLTGLLIFSHLKTYRRLPIENAKSIKQQPAIRHPSNRVGIILLIIILVSLLSHLALPLVYQAGCGGDKWRHLAAEQWLSEGKVYAPAIFGQDKVEWQSFGPIKIPAVLLTGNKTSYAGMWGLTMAISWISGLPLFYVDLWLGLLLWSIFLPLLLYLLAGYFWRNKRWRCLLAFIPILFYPIQFYGGLTLPVSFSFLWFLWVIILFCEYLRVNYCSAEKRNRYLNWVMLISIFSLYFGYVLYLILGLEILLIAWLIKRLVRPSTLVKKQFYKRGRKLKLMIVLILCLIIFSISLPLLDTGYHYSHFKSDINLKYLLKSTGDFINRLVFGQGIFLQSKFVEQDGLIYMNNQEMQQSSQLVNFIPWPFLLTPLVWLFVIWGIIKIKRMRYPRIGYLLFIFLCLTLINQFIGANLMEGSHLFTKR